MHWLADQVAALEASAPSPGVFGTSSRTQRHRFLQAVHELVEAAARRPGVLAAFGAYDGLLVAKAGDADFEALAATAQRAMEHAAEAPAARALGRLRQLVLVGEAHKLALVGVGGVVVGLFSPVDVSLAEATAR